MIIGAVPVKCVLNSSTLYQSRLFAFRSHRFIGLVMIVAEISSGNVLCLIATEKGYHAECKENESWNPLSFFTEGVDVNCKDDELNAIFYTRKAASHFSIGEFTRLFALD